jgi:DNA helicase II / ATP-dependent DNA helicase PcrA
MENVTDNLNPTQREAVLNTEGPMMVLAGAGSGKTRTLVTRIHYLLETKDISPYKLLAMTFSNKAAREMKERIASMSEYDLGSLQITTFHSFCARLLRIEADYIGLSRNFTIYDDGESISLIKSIMGRRGLNQKEISPHSIMYFISDIKNYGYYVGRTAEYEFNDDYEIDIEDLFFDIYEEYEHELHKSNAVDFGGLITGAIQLFEKHPKVLDRYQKRYDYVLVDEYQDTNRAQFTLVYLLSQVKQNICVVGDEDQSIYSWRGADIRNILDFEKVYKDAKIVKLEQNYRSSKTIINAASCVISNNEQRKGKEMWTDNHDGDLIKIVECPDDRSEGEFVARNIQKIRGEGNSYQEMAVFYRNNSQSRIIEDYLRRARIPYRVVAGIKFYERKEIKDLLCYLRIIVNPKDSLALSRIINVPARGIGATSLRKIENEAIANQISLWEMLERLVEFYEEHKHLKLSAKVRSGLGHLVNLIQEAKLLDEKEEVPSNIYDKILNESGYLDFLRAAKTHEAKARIENLDELASAISQFEETTETPSLLTFLETITLDTSTEEEENKEGQVSLMTVHGSKGLEYQYVFVTGAEETLFPSYRALEEGEMAIEEERRLFYVAMTRAMKELFISYARGRMLWGSLKFNGPSRFLDEIPDEYVDWKKTKKAGIIKENFVKDGVDYDPEFSQDNGFKIEDEVSYQIKEEVTAYPKGCRIKHQLYGEGIVLDHQGFGHDEKIVIKFKDGAKKKFMVKFSPLERL